METETGVLEVERSRNEQRESTATTHDVKPAFYETLKRLLHRSTEQPLH